MRYMSSLSISHKKIRAFNFDPTTNFLFCTVENEIYILDSYTFRVYGVIRPPTKDSISNSNYSTSLYVMVVVTQTTVWIYSIYTGNLVHKFESPGGDYCCDAGFSYDGRYFVSIYNDGYYVLYSVSQIPKPEKGNNFFDIDLNIICKEKYDHAIISYSYSAGGELIALGFDNGKVIIRSTDKDKSYQWLVQAHDQKSNVCVYFNPNNAFQFMTRSIKNGKVKFFRISQYGMKPKNASVSKKKKTSQPLNEIECYRHFTLEKSLHICYSNFSNDGTILYASSARKLFAFRVEDGSIINKLEFEQHVEIQSFTEISPHALINHVALIIEKSSLWIWNCFTNDIRCIVVQDAGEPLFQFGNWYESSIAMIQTNAGTINLYACETLQWDHQAYIIDEYKGPWSDKISRLLGKYIWLEPLRTMALYEKRGLEFFSQGCVDLNSYSESDSED